MSQVKRYDIETDGFGNFSIGPDTSGRYVTFEDYAAMEQRAEAAEAKLAGADKQPRPDYFLNRIESSDKWGQEVELRIYESQLDASKSQEDHGGAIIELFIAPVPPQ